MWIARQLGCGAAGFELLAVSQLLSTAAFTLSGLGTVRIRGNFRKGHGAGKAAAERSEEILLNPPKEGVPCEVNSLHWCERWDAHRGRRLLRRSLPQENAE
jgi:hypothetical protein